VIIEPGSEPKLSEEGLLICTDTIAGSFLATKEWRLLDVDNVCEIDFNIFACDMSALSEARKDMIAALVRSAKASSAKYDDLIQDKDKGVIFLLYGPVGVGKMLTAGMVL
jgi:hypothetical protein